MAGMSDTAGETGMIKHIVMWKVEGKTPEEHRKACLFLKERFEGLAGLIPGLLKIEVGVDFSRIDYACDVVLYSEFDSREALEAYASHPEHLRVKGELGSSRIARHQVDYRT
ncbi:Stress responsive A/B Barrel Domain protein [compost metagenome]